MMYKTNDSIICIQAEATKPIYTNIVFWSHDRGTAKLRFKLMKENTPLSLAEGTTVPIRLRFKSETAEGGYGKHDYLATIEDRVNGIVSIVLEDNILGYVGKVEGSVYIDFPNDLSLDTAGRFTFYIKRSPIDDSMPELEDYYFNGFSQNIDKIEKILADRKLEIDQKIAESETQIDGKLKDTNDKITKANQDIEHAKKCAAPDEIETGEIIGGFAHEQVFALADKVIDAVKNGDIRKFVVMAGCDGRARSRSYYTEFAKALPHDTVILTAGCAKYKYNKLPLGDINGIPRVLDAGQCNDSYSLVLIALKLKEIFGLDDINDLPIVYNIAWYEQKAVIVLLALLYLGVKNIHLGPTLPAFLSPNVAKILVENFGISGIGSVEEDMEEMIG